MSHEKINGRNNAGWKASQPIHVLGEVIGVGTCSKKWVLISGEAHVY
jgi:hypothetical protein